MRRRYLLAMAFVIAGAVEIRAEPVRIVHLDVATFFTVPQPYLPREHVETCFRIGLGQRGFHVTTTGGDAYKQKLDLMTADLALSVLAESLPAGNVALSVVIQGRFPVHIQKSIILWATAEQRHATAEALAKPSIFFSHRMWIGPLTSLFAVCRDLAAGVHDLLPPAGR